MDKLQQHWVIACIDGSAMSDHVVDAAAWIAEQVNSPLEIMHTLERDGLTRPIDHSASYRPNMREDLIQELAEQERAESKRLIVEGKQLLDAQKHRLAGLAIKNIMTKQRHGNLAEALKGIEDQIRVLVVGLRGEDHEDQEKVMGAQLEDTIRAIHKPIYVVNGVFQAPRSLLLAYNDTEAARKALKFVCESPLYADIEIHLVHVNDKPQIGQAILEAAEVSLIRSGRHYSTALLNGDPQTALLTYQQTQAIDLIVMGALTHGSLHQLFFGSMALKVLQRTTTSVLLIR
ncbi:universal stress protein UspA [Thiomicrospira aerophila AL3]|uniref:Universal stress protein UspA n=1 Tax=Thiomicrospira aerophila AL3 TaxID=717772 RepID=W0DW52_9GAMM|nr:universal stress protein [Thiomicrospira aerophila]AHF01199.1 universal stress protein UspA [Thiomicrospira aerophila AL3]